MTRVPAHIFDTIELEDPGLYFWKVEGPGREVERDEYDDNGETTGRKYPALQVFLIAQKKAIYDEEGNLMGTEKPSGVSLNHNFKIKKPDGSFDRRGLTMMKSLYVVNTGVVPKPIENDDGDLDYDIPLIGDEMNGFEGWNALVHSEIEGKQVQYLQGNFKKAAPERVKV